MKSSSQKTLSLVVGAIALAVASGCKSHEGAYQPVNAQSHDYERTSNFVLLDPGAQRSVTSGSAIQSMTLPDGRLRVMAPIRNRENRRIQVQVNCVFKDEQNFPTGDETAWRTLFLDENATEGVEFVSMNDKAKNFTIRVRQAR